MNSPNLVRQGHIGKFEAHADEIIAMRLAGRPQREIAEYVGGTLRGLQQFLERHDVDLREAKADAVEAVKHLWITDKVQRTTILQEVAELTLAELRTYGIVTEQIMIAEDGGPITTRKYRHELSKEIRGLLKDAAIEEGQIVTPLANKGGMVREVIIREYEGVPQDWIG